MADALLRDQRVLVVEDEYLIAEAMERGLRRAGAIVLGPVSNVAAALALLEREGSVDGAVLDINLGDQKVYPVVDALLAQGARCVFATGNDPSDVPSAYAAIARCDKPVDARCIAYALTDEAAGARMVEDEPRRRALSSIRDQLRRQVDLADDAGLTLLAVRIQEALDVAEGDLKG
ncbi:response regulator [Sphingomonas rubra]|uniref:Response regulator receiver domain-containing protein n=1 Tax=Sphingomonas rubra TaxID=634430 RepID=A0A1I5RQ55_9SPHN|nr:response regulator [Sphingomonas rubra]SFP60633.1 Response regulator receiver domain-containing protein [Sphingomonas rubra]